MDLFRHFFQQPAINQVEPGQVQKMITQSPRPFLLDVRTPQEYKESHIRGAELVPLDELSRKLDRIPKDREIICICASGSRSSAAARHLAAQGFTVTNMHGGMSQWIRTGLPTVKGAQK